MTARGWLAAALAFLALSAACYAPALAGPFLSDDLAYVAENPYVQSPGAGGVVEILDPRGGPAGMLANYAPLHLGVHALQWQLFGPWTPGYHATNLALHVLAALLLAAWLLQLGLGRAAALAGAAVFLLHPANVEAVAWISQLKSTLALTLALAATCLHPRRPALALAAFTGGMLAKVAAGVALPVAALAAWLDGSGSAGRRRMAWLAAWAAVAVAVSWAQLDANRHADSGVPPIHPDPWLRVLSSVAFAGRYLVMAATSLGTSAFQEPPPVLSPMEPRFLLAALLLLAATARAVRALRRRSPECLGWAWAAVAFLPVSQVVPFRHPVADRYLYFMLPGLIAAALFVARDLAAWLAGRGVPLRRPGLRAAGVALLLLGLVFFGLRTHGRAALWASADTLLADAARSWPDGSAAGLLEATLAARRGDAVAAAAALRGLAGEESPVFVQVQQDPDFASVRDHPAVRGVLMQQAGRWIDHVAALEAPREADLALAARAHLLRGEPRLALRALRRAAALEGPQAPALRALHDEILGHGASGPPGPPATEPGAR